MITIIGAGPAGLSAAHHLDREHRIYERDEEAGGLCRSFAVAGATVDVGGHAFFSRHDEVHALLAELGVELYAQPRNAVVWSHGTFVPYPFQHNLHGLPVEVVRDCVAGAFRAESAPSAGPARDMADWIQRSFGAGIAEHFMAPYNEKLWGYPLAELVPMGTSDRIVAADPEKVLDGALRRTAFDAYPNATVRYPVRGGFAEIFRPLIDRAADRIVRRRVTGLDLDRRELRFDDGGGEDFDEVVSTMPLPDLVAGTTGLGPCCHEAAAALRWNSLWLVTLVFAGGARTGIQRVYCADPAVPFHKLVLNANSSPDLRSRPVFSFQAEVSHTPHKPVSSDGLVERTLASLVAMGLVDRGETPVGTSVVDVPYAYPVHTARTEAARQHLLGELAAHGVLGAGRFGEWLYINSDGALLRGKARADEIEGRLVAAGHR